MSIADAPAIAPLNPPRRILLGPGPSPVDDRVLRSMAAPLMGHLDPLFVRTMDEVQELLRYVFETNNRLTMPISGTGSAGMEATVANLLEPGEEIVICINGYFGERMHEMALRVGAKPVRVNAHGAARLTWKKRAKPGAIPAQKFYLPCTRKLRPACCNNSNLCAKSPTNATAFCWWMP